MGARTMTRCVINQSYWTQQVTGQQRYATEISRRLEASAFFAAARPTGRWSTSTLRVWAWVQLVLPARAGHNVVLSMTSRAPLWRRLHVLVVHDLFVLTNPEWFSRWYVWTHAPLLRAQIRSAAAVIAVSRPVADQLARLRSDVVAVAPNAPSAAFRRVGVEAADDALRERDLVSGTYFLVVGSRDPRKNLSRLAEAYGRLDGEQRRAHPLVVVGGASAVHRDEELSWPTHTVVTGYVSDDELRQLYAGARTVVFVSLAEGFGLPLVEAAAAGARSLLVSDIEVFRWICGDRARYVNPTSTASIVDGLHAEIDGPQHEEVEVGRFSWEVSASVVEEVCRAVAGRP